MLQIRLANTSKSQYARYVDRHLQNLKETRELLALRENRTRGSDHLGKIQNDAQSRIPCGKLKPPLYHLVALLLLDAIRDQRRQKQGHGRIEHHTNYQQLFQATQQHHNSAGAETYRYHYGF